jgi:prolyl-tRNA synthetase
VNTFRFEGKNTRPLIRVREITTFKEAHTCHADAQDCEQQIREGISIYKKYFDAMGIPYIITCRPKWDTFPGANYTIAFDCIFPAKHRTLQIGTVHNLGDTFAKTFDIKFSNKEGKMEYVHQTCYGISERSIAALLASHGDNLGLILPPSVAPIQVIIVPIYFKGKEQIVKNACQELFQELRSANIRVEFDDKEMSSGRKFYYWEMKGVPLRIEVGPKDIEKQQICTVRRDIQDKQTRKKFIPQLNVVVQIKEMLDQIQTHLWEEAKTRHVSLVKQTTELNEAIDYLDKNQGVMEIPFCGDENCAADVEKQLESLKFLGIPDRYLKALNPEAKEEENLFCAKCGTKAKYYWRIGRSY